MNKVETPNRTGPTAVSSAEQRRGIAKCVEQLARKAEKAHQKITVLNGRQVRLGQEQIEGLIHAGELLLEAKAAIPHGKFEKELKCWREEGVITFSDRSARRYMLMGKHAAEIKMATVASLREAEQMAAALEKEGRTVASEEQAPEEKEPDNFAVEAENQVIKMMRRRFRDPEAQRDFLVVVIEKLTSRLHLL